jgi:hypothetical protein
LAAFDLTTEVAFLLEWLYARHSSSAFGKDINTLKCFVERLKVCAAEKQVLAGAAGLKLAFPDRARDRDSYKRANPREISEF